MHTFLTSVVSHGLWELEWVQRHHPFSQKEDTRERKACLRGQRVSVAGCRARHKLAESELLPWVSAICVSWPWVTLKLVHPRGNRCRLRGNHSYTEHVREELRQTAPEVLCDTVPTGGRIPNRPLIWESQRVQRGQMFNWNGIFRLNC